MSLIYILETIFIGPLKLVFEVIYSLAFRFLDDHGFSIVALSLAMNFLVLPLYRRADAMQEQARDTENKLSRVVAHIKKTFTGDERMMILQTYYRQNNYKPTDALRGSVSLLLEIPFFMAAYQFLSGMTVLSGQSFGPISDLASPDGLLTVAGVTINVLPVLMTLINVISSAIYLKGFPMKTKIQLYGMAAFFLVFLYNSPSGLVFYWTLNNLFSLAKTIVYKLKNPMKVLKTVLAICTFSLSYFALKAWKAIRAKRTAAAVDPKANKKLFLLSCTVLAILTGLMIPSSIIGASAQEFVDVHSFHHPINYILSSGAYSIGTFLVWVPVFYWLASDKGKVILSRLVAVVAVASMVNFMFFGWNLGMISTNLQYSKGFFYSRNEKLINLAVFAVVMGGGWWLASKKKKVMTSILAVAIMGTAAMTGWSSFQIFRGANEVKAYMENMNEEEAPNFRLSQNGENVVVIMLDRAVGYFMPYYLQEKPELQDRLGGFTYYNNVLSYGGHTNFGAPPLVGGYEYTPVEMNKRDQESLEKKNDEALKVLPVLFNQNGYEVTVCDPPYAGYTWVPDLSIFDEYPEIKTYITKGYFKTEEQRQSEISNNYRNFFCFGIMRCMPVATQRWMYESGRYHQEYTKNPEYAFFNQTATSLSQATGMNGSFMDSYSVLKKMTDMTTITAEQKNTYLFLANEAAHSPVLLQMPDYEPSQFVDNTGLASREIKDINGNTLTFTNTTQMGQYHTGMAMILQLADWFDYLREQGVYDNTRIILVADHGYNLGQLEELDFKEYGEDGSFYYPLLMVKDFDATGKTAISYEFMTNADVPTLATQGIIENPVNPFTGKPINSDEKYAHDQMVIISREWSADVNNGNTFIADRWASVHTDMRDPNNWTFYTGSTVLKEHKLPQ